MTTPPALIVPFIHLNGTSPDVLYAALRETADALADARSLLHKACPHGRDYYPYPNADDQMNLAVKQHSRRIVTITRLIDELAREAEHISLHSQEQR